MKKSAKWKVPSMVTLMLRKSVFSPLLACLAAGALYSLFHFYTIYVYLSKYGVNVNDLALILLVSVALRLIASPCLYLLINFLKQGRWRVQGRRSVFFFGLTSCSGFILLWHPWSAQLLGLQLALAIVLFEVSMENMMSELSRVFELQLFALKKPMDLTLLVEIVFTTGAFGILCVQLTTKNTFHLLGLELAFFVVTILAGGCFLFSSLFYPSTAQLTLLKSRKQVVSSVTNLHNIIFERIGSVLNATNRQELENGNSLDGEQLDNHPATGPLNELSRLFTNPHFYWPCIGRALRQARMLFNVAFLVLFTQLFLVSFGRFLETGFGINLYFLLCLTMHAVMTKLLWKILRDSGPIVVNSIVCMLAVAVNVLILIFGRSNYFLTMCYIFFLNVFSSSCSQITYSMFLTNFVEMDFKSHPNSQPLSKKKVAFVSGLLASTLEYLVLALTLVLLSYSSDQFETFVQNPAPFAEKCQAVSSTPPTLLALQLIKDVKSSTSDLQSGHNSSTSNTTFAPLASVLVMKTEPNETVSDNSTLLQMTNMEEPVETAPTTDTSLCKKMLDMAFLVAVLVSTSMAAAELLAMKLYKGHFVWKLRKKDISIQALTSLP